MKYYVIPVASDVPKSDPQIKYLFLLHISKTASEFDSIVASYPCLKIVTCFQRIKMQDVSFA